MDIEGRRRSDNFEDRGRGAGHAGLGVPVHALIGLVRVIGFKGTLAVAAVVGLAYVFLPSGIKQQLFGNNQDPVAGGASAASVCQASPSNNQACDFSRAVLASTEDVWTAAFRNGALPKYGRDGVRYSAPTLVVFAVSVDTGCGTAASAVGPFYCPRDRRLYIDPRFYRVMESRLRAPGDFAQAYVIAHEVGHHVQNLIGATRLRPSGEGANQISVRVELQADCLAGVWGHTARTSLAVDEQDLKEAVNAAHAIGDDALGNRNPAEHTHGTSAQRMRWFRRGFETGDARQCDTFGIGSVRGL